MGRRVGILTGGGDAPGLNAVIRAFVKHGVGNLGLDVVGVCDAFNGLIEVPHRVMPMDLPSCRGLLQLGGTILGTTNRGDPFAYGPDKVDQTGALVAGMRDLDLEGLVCIGGEGTQGIALRLMETCGVPVVGVPKTIDNDLDATDLTFGFQSAVDVATDALDRLHTTAESHDRVMVLEVMGRDAGHIALSAGLSGGADVILVPEIPWTVEGVAAKILARRAIGRSFSLIVVAEGAAPADEQGRALPTEARKALLRRAGGAGALVMQSIAQQVDAEVRLTVLGHLQRGGSPVAFDRLLATRFGVQAAELVAAGGWGRMVRLSGRDVGSVDLREAVARYRGVDADGELVRVARSVGISFGG
jgi:phosphofructokinase-like protein